jgi:hypothetical protein
MLHTFARAAVLYRRYVLQPRALPSRRLKVPEAWLAANLAQLSNPLRARLDTATRQQVRHSHLRRIMG